MGKYNSNMLTTKFVQDYIKNRLWERDNSEYVPFLSVRSVPTKGKAKAKRSNLTYKKYFLFIIRIYDVLLTFLLFFSNSTSYYIDNGKLINRSLKLYYSYLHNVIIYKIYDILRILVEVQYKKKAN